MVGFVLLAACGGGGGGSGGGSGSGSGGSTKTLLGYAITNYEGSNGNATSTAVYSDGSGTPVNSLSGNYGTLGNDVVEKTINGHPFIFMEASNPNEIFAFSLDASTGQITQLPGITGLSLGVQCLAISHSSNYLFALLSDGSSAEIQSYAIGTDGSLTPVQTTSLPTGYGGGSIFEDATGRYLISVDQASTTAWNIFAYLDDENGTLTYQNELTDQTTIPPCNFVVDPNTKNGDYVYTCGAGTDIVILNIDNLVSGSGSSLSVYSTGLSGNQLSLSWIDPTGTWLYVESCTLGTSSCTHPPLNQFVIASNGSLSAGTFAPITLETSNSSSEAGYDATTGTVVFPGASGVAEYQFSSLDGSLSPIAKEIPIGSVVNFLFVQ